MPYISKSPGTAIKKRPCVREPLKQPTFFYDLTMETSKDSQFLEVCKEPILTDLPVLIKTESRLGPFEPFLRFAPYTRGTL